MKASCETSRASASLPRIEQARREARAWCRSTQSSNASVSPFATFLHNSSFDNSAKPHRLLPNSAGHTRLARSEARAKERIGRAHDAILRDPFDETARQFVYQQSGKFVAAFGTESD